MSEPKPLEQAFDHHSADYAEHNTAIEAGLRARCPVSWSAQHGGFWVVASHAGVTGALRDRERCSSAKQFNEHGEVVGGVSIPGQNVFTMVPLESDPPEWDGYRKLLNPVFSPSAVRALQPRLEAFTTEVVNNVIETGHVDLVLDIASPVTALITLDILGLPLGDWHFYAGPVHEFGYTQGRDPAVLAAIDRVLQRLRDAIAERQARPGHGLIADLVAAKVNGKPIPDKTLLDIVYLLLVGGFDTTSALMANALWYLDQHRGEHARLVSDDGFMRTATEEFLRWVSPIMTFGRVARREFEIGGQAIHPGERLLMVYHSANRDSEVFDLPDEVDLARFPNRHVAFGNGIHRCLGSNLARAIFQIVLRQVLQRMPDYRVDHARARRFPARAVVNGWIDMPASFTPGPRLESGLSLHGALLAAHADNT